MRLSSNSGFRIFLLLLLALAGCSSLQSDRSPASSSLTLGPYLQNMTSNSVILMWHTKKPEPSVVAFHPTEGETRYARSSEKTQDHEITISDLKPETLYSYQVLRADEQILAEGSFTTAPHASDSKGKPFRFVVWGDSQTDPSTFSTVAAAMLGAAPNFGIGVGDYADHEGEASPLLNEFFRPGSKFIANIPVLLAAGNHDYGMVHDHFDFSPNSAGIREFKSLFRNPSGDRTYYSFNYRNAHFIILDPNEGRSMNHFDIPEESAQFAWLMKDLESADFQRADYRFVFFHEPPFATVWNGEYYDGEEDIRKHLVPLFESHHVTAVFNGHSHVYQRGSLNGVTYVITGGGGGELDTEQHKQWPQVSVLIPEHHFIQVDISGAKSEVQAITPKGVVIDHFSLEKAN